MTHGTITVDEVLSISEQLSLGDQLLLIVLLSERLRQELDRDSKPVDMLSLAGMGAELWRKADVDGYLEEERSTWDS